MLWNFSRAIIRAVALATLLLLPLDRLVAKTHARSPGGGSSGPNAGRVDQRRRICQQENQELRGLLGVCRHGAGRTPCFAENTAPWKADDGSVVRTATLSLRITPYYDKEVDVPDSLTQAIVRANAKISWIQYSIDFDSDGSWAVQCNTDVFLKGLPPETLGYYLQLLTNDKGSRKDAFLTVIDEALNPKPK